MHFALLVTPRGPRSERRGEGRALHWDEGAIPGGAQRKGDGRMSLEEYWGPWRGGAAEVQQSATHGGQIPPIACSCTVHELKTVLHF